MGRGLVHFVERLTLTAFHRPSNACQYDTVDTICMPAYGDFEDSIFLVHGGGEPWSRGISPDCRHQSLSSMATQGQEDSGHGRAEKHDVI